MGNKAVGRAIAYYRKLCGLSQKELGQRLGVTDKCISSWEAGRTEPNIGAIEKMAFVLGCQKTDIIGGEIEFTLENEEIADLVQAYLKADDMTKAMVWKILGK